MEKWKSVPLGKDLLSRNLDGLIGIEELILKTENGIAVPVSEVSLKPVSWSILWVSKFILISGAV